MSVEGEKTQLHYIVSPVMKGLRRQPIKRSQQYSVLESFTNIQKKKTQESDINGKIQNPDCSHVIHTGLCEHTENEQS